MEFKNLVEIPLKLSGKLFRSPMPYARFDLEQTTFEEMLGADVSTVVMLIEENEDHHYTGKDLKEEYSRQNIDVIHYPIKDFDTPEDSSQLRSQLDDVIGRIDAGERVAVHCFAGRGRTGLFIALLARLALDLNGDDSIDFVRQYFKAIETPLQEQMVREFLPNDLKILFESEDIYLRDVLESDIDLFLKWMTSGEWRYYDAPWEGIQDSFSEEEESKYRQFFMKIFENPLEDPRKKAYICLKDGTPIGRVNRYSNDRFPNVFYLGISIFEDKYLDKGFGTKALQSWIDYLLLNSKVHKVELHTWSLNPRMIRVAEKLGFKLEGTERKLIEWQGDWQDRYRFGLLRQEWEEIRS